MLDIQLIRDDRAAVLEGLAKRMDRAEAEAALSDALSLDERRRALIAQVDAERQKRNEEAQRIAAAKRAGQEVPRPSDPAASKKALVEMEGELRRVEGELHDVMAGLPNVPADDVVAGGKEANEVVKVWGELPELEEVRDHVELASSLGLVDFERGVKLGGSGFWLYRGAGARLEWALVTWFVRQHLDAGYHFMLPPHLLLESAGFASGQFPKFRDDVYHLANPDGREGQFLLPTSETAILGAFQNETVDAAELPMKLFAYTPCYRREKAGTHSDERGTVRGHQFNKVEIFQLVAEDGAAAAHEEMVRQAELLVEGLGLHYRTSLLAAGDATAAMRKTLDVEVWMPSTGKYKEVSSVSWAGDYQARRARIRYKEKGGKPRFVHTLNGSALATSRIFPAILEQYQQPDGSVRVPEVLQDAVGADVIGPEA
ncbi:MAG TPA: serine--tRNA ligase [Actinomycetota bacterium]|nr:serine--tRNA ligase [Actinomycetota bacterium]